MYIQKRNIGLYVVLSILTCGIFALYWMACLQDDTNNVTGNTGEQSGGIVVLLDIVTCGIYGIYWAFRQGEKLEAYYAANNKSNYSGNQNLAILYLILGVCNMFTGVTLLVALALMQEKINQEIDAGVNGTPAPAPAPVATAPAEDIPVAEPVTEVVAETADEPAAEE